MAEAKTEAENYARDEIEKTRQKFEENLKEARARLEREQNKRLVASATNERKSLANLRSELVEELFNAIADKLNKYVESDVYKQRLARELDEISKKYRSAEAYLTRRDYDYLSSLPEDSAVRDVALKIGETRMIGGFILICPRDGIKIDKSFITTLEEAKSGFSLIKIV